MGKEIIPYQKGTPPRVINEKEAIGKAEARTRKRLLKYIKKLEELAAGVYMVEPKRTMGADTELVMRDTESGEERVIGQNLVVYKLQPDLKALAYLIDRAMGKAPQRYEITGEEGGPVQVIPWMPAGATIEGEYEEV